MLEDDRSRIEDLLYYLNLMAGRHFNGSLTVWMYDGRISRGTFRKLRQQLTLSGIPFEAKYEMDDDQEEAHAKA